MEYSDASHRSSLMFMRPALLLPSLLAIVPMLEGCTMTATKAMAAASASFAADRRTVGTIVEDESIEWKLRATLHDAGLTGGDSNVNVTSYNRVVLLTGQTPDEEKKARAGDHALRVAEVRAVHNELTVGPPVPLGVRTSDSAITARVKLALAKSGAPRAGTNVKVVTENGVVFLMGLLPREVGATVTKTAQTIGGVRQIVRLFEYREAG